MRFRYFSMLSAALVLTLGNLTAHAKEVVPMLGGVLIDGYDFGTDIGPKGDTDLHYCGHGQDFFYAKAPEKQVCYD